MLKRFFISLLGTMAGLWISVAVLFFGGLMVLGAIIGKNSGDNVVKIDNKSVLYFDLSGEISERYQPTDFFTFIQQQGQNVAPTLEEMINSLRLAANDDRIKGLCINCGGSAMGTASREELLEAIAEFKEHDKWIYAYSNTYSQGDYLIASTADKITLNPMGSVDIHGVGGMTPFFKGLLDKVGVKMQIIKVGTYKSAVEPYILTGMSEPARQQMQQYVDSIWSFTASTIATNRNMSTDSIYAMAPQMIFTRPTETFVNDGLVDSLLYARQFDNDILELLDLDSDHKPNYVTPTDYLANNDINSLLNQAGEHIAVLYAVGDIVDSGNGGIVGPDMVEQIVDLADNDNVSGLVLRVNSPGGSAFASEQIWEALQYFKSKDKPFYVSMGDYAASGGYYISCGADSIFADRTTLTGSIGVFGMIPDFSGLVTDKLGVHFSTVQSNANAAGINAFESMTPAQHAAMQQSVENIYELFTSRVAEGRGLEQSYVKTIAEGRVWIGSNAIELGLVDRIGSLNTAVQAMADELGMTSKQVVAYPRIEMKMWEKILRESGGLDQLKEAGYDAEALRLMNEVTKLRNAAFVQARMEPVQFTK